MKTTFFALLLISTSLAIKIKIRTPKNQQSSDSGAPTTTGGWNTIRQCNPIAPNINVATLFSLYAEQIQSICSDPINELLLVKHESQVVAGTNHRLIFRVRDKQTNDKLYFGFSLFVDLQGGVRITGYLESFDLNEIVSALGFSNRRLFRYRCGNLSDSAVLGFNDWARELLGGGVTQHAPMDDLDQFDQNNFQTQPTYGGNVPVQTQPTFGGNVPVQTQPTFGGNVPVQTQPTYGGNVPVQTQQTFGGSDCANF